MSGEENHSEINGTSEEISEEIDEENVIKILVATDIHLGYNEKDPIRGEDSFNTFEEILQNAVSNEVDFVLLGGDLFHENKPSVTCYHKCISLLKKYCLGDKPVTIEFLSDQSKNFGHLKQPIVNYEDPNLNVSIPVFSIHGNHDDPTGEKQLSAMDIIADTGLVNYFGKWSDLNQVEIYPILMKKGQTKLAIFGLSHIKDERLFRLFKDKKVKMLKPPDPDWFNLLVLHQNRAQNRGLKNFIPESVLPDFLNLVIWGHEHDCLLAPHRSSNGVTMISQPGSSVATSLAAGESLIKKVGLLCVHKEKFMMSEIKLNTVRPFIYRDVTITKPEEGFRGQVTASDYGKEKIMAAVEEMLKEAQEITTDESPKLPLIRLIVNFTDESLVTGNQIRMGQLYNDRVANPNDMFSYKVKRFVNVNRDKKHDIGDIDELIGDEIEDNLQHLINKYFESRKQNLNVLSTRGLCEAVSRFVDKNDTDAIEDIYRHQFQKTFDRIVSMENLELDSESIDEVLEQLRQERESKAEEELAEIEKVLDTNKRKKQSKSNEDSNDETMEVLDTSSDSSKSKTSTRGTTSRRGRGSRSKADDKLDDSNGDSTSRGSTSTRRGRGSRGPRSSRARTKAWA